MDAASVLFFWQQSHIHARPAGAARAVLGWRPRYDFGTVLDRLKAGQDPRSPLARAVGAKGYHAVPTGPYTVR